MVMVGLVVLGLFGYRRLPIDQFPDVDIPIVSVQTVYPGASSETIEREVTRRLEEAFNPVAGVDRITSISLEGVSSVIVEFDLGRDVDVASQDIRAKSEGIRRELPTDIESPVVQNFDPAAQPIVSLALSSNAQSIDRLAVPAAAMIQALPSQKMTEATVIARGTEVRLKSSEGEADTGLFRVQRDLRVLPIFLERSEAMERTVGGWRLVLDFRSYGLRKDPVDVLSLYVRHLDAFRPSLAVFHALRTHLEQVSVLYNTNAQASPDLPGDE
jgi:hypothetical protein